MYVSREENELFFLLTVPPVQKCFHNNGHLFCFHCNPLLSAKKMYALSSMHLKSRLQTSQVLQFPKSEIFAGDYAEG